MDMFSSVEAGQAALALLNGEGETYLDNLEYMGDDTDAVTEAYETMADTTATSWNRVKAQFSEAAIMIFQALAPALEKLLDVLTSDEFKKSLKNMADSFSTWLTGDKAEDVIDGVVGALQTLLDLLSRKQSLGDWLWDGLAGLGDKMLTWINDNLVSAMEGVVNGLIDIVNTIFAGLNQAFGWAGVSIDPLDHVDYGFDLFGSKKREQARAAKEAKEKRKKESAPDRDDWESESQMREATRPGENVLPEYTSPLAKGSSGDDVTALQTFLTGLGYELGEIDGKFGEKTEKALSEFQGDHGLGVTGTVTRGTDTLVQDLKSALAVVNTYNRENAPGFVGPPSVSTSEYDTAVQTLTDAGITIQTSVTDLGTNAETAATDMETVSTSSQSLFTAVDATQGDMVSAAVAALGLKSAASVLKTAISTLASKLRSIIVPKGATTSPGAGGNGVTAGSYAVGLDSVPYDGYRAILHKGETVLNAAAASAYRVSGDYAALNGYGPQIDYDALAAAMSRLSINMDGQRVGRLVERGVSTRQMERSTSYSRSH